MCSGYYYSPKYEDDKFEYRHVHIPKNLARRVPTTRLMTESEWISLGIKQSSGWVHYMIHDPERHVLLFRRAKSLSSSNGNVENQNRPGNSTVGIRG